MLNQIITSFTFNDGEQAKFSAGVNAVTPVETLAQ